jgi:hypothetical protein
MKFINILFLFLHCFIVCIISLVSTYKDGGYKAQNKAHTSIILYKNIFNDTDIGCSSCAHTWKRKNSFIRSKKLTRNGKNNFRFSSCYNFLFIYTYIKKFPYPQVSENFQISFLSFALFVRYRIRDKEKHFSLLPENIVCIAEGCVVASMGVDRKPRKFTCQTNLFGIAVHNQKYIPFTRSSILYK